MGELMKMWSVSQVEPGNNTNSEWSDSSLRQTSLAVSSSVCVCVFVCECVCVCEYVCVCVCE